MNVFMLSWEFPPFISGGLGTACHGLTEALAKEGTKILLVLPSGQVRVGGGGRPSEDVHAGLGTGRNVHFCHVPLSVTSSYARPISQGMSRLGAHTASDMTSDVSDARICGFASRYEGDLLGQAEVYARLCLRVARRERFAFDLVHAHDWSTFPAGMAVAAASGKPLVVHVHSTEFDRSGENVNQPVYEIERAGMRAAQTVFAVSNLTREILVCRYGIAADKICVVHNGVRQVDAGDRVVKGAGEDKVVLFLGRVTMQKGPEYFIAAARRVLEIMDDVKFIVAGTGDLWRRIVELAAEWGIGHRVLFAGFLGSADVLRAFRMADLYVMPSVSEPFGIAPLEAASQHVPVLVSKTSGVAEVLRNALKVDFWDVDEMANKIVGVLRHPPLAEVLHENACAEMLHLTWDRAARACLNVYARLLTL